MSDKKQKGHIISFVHKNSIAMELDIASGDKLLAINNQRIEDIFDYQYLTQEEYIEVLIQKPSGEEWLLEIDKEYVAAILIELLFEKGLVNKETYMNVYKHYNLHISQAA